MFVAGGAASGRSTFDLFPPFTDTSSHPNFLNLLRKFPILNEMECAHASQPYGKLWHRNEGNLSINAFATCFTCSAEA